jgi:hypothetical protein
MGESNEMRVYLGGSINGCNDEEAMGWWGLFNIALGFGLATLIL